MPLLIYFFLGWGWPWVGEFVGFIIPGNIYKFFNPTELGKSQTPYYRVPNFGKRLILNQPPSYKKGPHTKSLTKHGTGLLPQPITASPISEND